MKTKNAGRLKNAFLILLLLSFVGQSVAAAKIPCAQMNGHAGTMHSPAVGVMDHSDHSMASVPGPESGSGTCCDDITCLVIHCVTVVPFVGSNSPFELDFARVFADYLAFSYAIPELSPLFRPPIFH